MKAISYYPMIADLISVLFFWVTRGFWQTRLVAMRNETDFGIGMLIGLVYLGFILGFLAIKKFQSTYPLPHFFADRRLMALFCVPFGVAIALAFSDLAYFLETMFSINFGDIGNGYYLLITPAIFLVFGLLYFLIAISPSEETLDSSRWGVPSLVGNGLFMGVTISYLVYWLGNSAVTTLVILLSLLYFFTLPRLFYYYKTRHAVSLYSYAVMLLVFTVMIKIG